jgi:hypothetical protein
MKAYSGPALPIHRRLAERFNAAGEKYTDAIKAANPPAAWLCEDLLRGEGLCKRWHHVRKLLANTTKADQAG